MALRVRLALASGKTGNKRSFFLCWEDETATGSVSICLLIPASASVLLIGSSMYERTKAECIEHYHVRLAWTPSPRGICSPKIERDQSGQAGTAKKLEMSRIHAMNAIQVASIRR
jgi:hypothetical protein